MVLATWTGLDLPNGHGNTDFGRLLGEISISRTIAMCIVIRDRLWFIREGATLRCFGTVSLPLG